MIYPFVLTTIAGLSTLLGTIPIFINLKNENKIIDMKMEERIWAGHL